MGLVGGLVGGVGDLVGGLLGGGKQTSTTPAPAQTTPAAPPPATSQQPSNPTKPTSQPPANPPSNPTPTTPSTPQESTPAPNTPDNSSPGTGNSGTDGSTDNDSPANDPKATNTNAFAGTPTSGAGLKPVVNVASPDPNIPLGPTPGGDGQQASSAPGGGGAITPGAGNVEWGTSTTEGSSAPTAGSLNDKGASTKSGFPLGAAAAIGVFGVLFALLIGLLCYRRVLLAKRRSRREQVRAVGGVRDTGVDWDFRDTRTSMFSIGSSVDSDSTAVMQAVPGGITVTTANHVAVDPYPNAHAAPYTPVSPAIRSPNTPASAGVHQPLIDIEAQAPSHVAYPYQDVATPTAASQSTRSLTAPSIVVPASSPRASNVSAASTVNPFTLARPENPVPPLSPLYGSFEEDPFASPYDGAVPTSSKTSLASHPENPFHPERA